MDLLDLYHAHDLQLASEGNFEEVHFTKRAEEDGNSSPESKGKIKKTRIVPWEPYKAAVAHDK